MNQEVDSYNCFDYKIMSLRAYFKGSRFIEYLKVMKMIYIYIFEDTFKEQNRIQTNFNLRQIYFGVLELKIKQNKLSSLFYYRLL